MNHEEIKSEVVKHIRAIGIDEEIKSVILYGKYFTFEEVVFCDTISVITETRTVEQLILLLNISCPRSVYGHNGCVPISLPTMKYMVDFCDR